MLCWPEGCCWTRARTPILIRHGRIEDVSRSAPTVADLLDYENWEGVEGKRLFGIDELFNLPRERFLAPFDLQVIKAAGVTFAISAIERVIEERARGDYRAAAAIREKVEAAIGGAIRSLVPGSEGAARLKDTLIEDGLWSQYLEVAIGPDAEIFTKTAPLASVGWGADIGVRSDSSWNNPEPEVVLAVNSRGEIRGATLGNDVNLRDFEGRSALLLSKAKDNNASCAIGPFIRLFDEQVHDRRRPQRRGRAGNRRRGRFHAQGPQPDERDQPRSGGARAAGAERASLSRRLRAVPRHLVRADRRPR